MFYSILTLIGTDTDYWLRITDQNSINFRTLMYVPGTRYLYWVLRGGRIYSYSFILFSDNQSVVCTDWCMYTWHVTRDTWHVTRDRAAWAWVWEPGGRGECHTARYQYSTVQYSTGISQFGQVISVTNMMATDIWWGDAEDAVNYPLIRRLI